MPQIIKNISPLDKIRMNEGIDNCRNSFYSSANESRERAIELINDENLLFPTLYSLKPEITKLSLTDYLNVKNKTALEISDKILNRSGAEKDLSIDDVKGNYNLLKWILETGYVEDGLSTQYDEILEAAAIIMIKYYKDGTSYKMVEEMIFSRHLRNSYKYDLIWALFESASPEILPFILERLRSNNSKEVELARKLLNFIPCIKENKKASNENLYQYAKRWLNQNSKFLYYTGESTLQTCDPNRFAISLESKYLQKPLINNHLGREEKLSDHDNELINSFSKLAENEKLILSDYSLLLYRNNKYKRNKWLQYPISNQLKYADTFYRTSLYMKKSLKF